MSATTVPHAPDGLDFKGTSGSYTTLPRSTGSWPTCKGCGSTLYPSRLVVTRVRVIGGSRLNVDKYRCRCGRGHEVPRAAA